MGFCAFLPLKFRGLDILRLLVLRGGLLEVLTYDQDENDGSHRCRQILWAQ